MNSLQVKYFLTLYKEKSFSKAAQKLYVTQPSFSQYIKKTEAEIGAELIDRSCSPFKLTAAGEMFYNACIQFAAIEEDMRSSISNLSELKSGRLSVGTTSFRASTMLSKSIAYFKMEYPSIEVTISEGSVKFLEGSVASGETELAICSEAFDENVFHSEILSDEHIYMAIPRNMEINLRLSYYRLENSDISDNSLKILKTPPCPVSEFEKLPYINLKHGEEIAGICGKIFREAGIRPNTVLSAHNLYTALSFVMEGVGITLVPDTMIKYGNMKDHPYYYAVDSSFSANSICLITRKNRYLSRAAEEYGRILKQLIQSGTWRI